MAEPSEALKSQRGAAFLPRAFPEDYTIQARFGVTAKEVYQEASRVGTLRLRKMLGWDG